MKTGLKTVINKYTFSLLILLNFNLFPQIPVNGFVKYINHKTLPGSTSLLSLNFNNDSYTDLLQFNPQKTTAYLLEGDGSGEFHVNIPVKFKYAPSSIKNLSFGKVFSRLYISVSRKNRSASVISFTDRGNILTLDEMKFDSYPEKIDVADADLDHAPDVILSGSAFNGISVLGIRDGKIISERKVAENTAFRDAVFIDYNNDGFHDIAAANIFGMSLDIYLNNSRDKFRLIRSFKFNSNPYNLISHDIDLDYYEDIIWGESKKINIRYGDMASQYDYLVSLPVEYNPHIIINGDFNSDGSNDIIYSDTSAAVVSVIFGKDNRTFSEELLLLKKNNISAIIPFYSKFITAVSAIDKNGHVYSISRLGSVAEDINISAGIKPGALNYFDYMNNGIVDICYIDEATEYLNFLIRSSEGIPEKLYRYKLHFPHNEIITDSYSKEVKTFYCWTRGEKLIEVITVDFLQNKFSRNSLYASGKIMELKIKPQKDNRAEIYASFIKDKMACANVFEFHNFRYSRTDYIDFASDVEYISPFIDRREEGFFTWQRRNELSLNSHNLKNLVSPRILGKMNIPEKIIPVTGDILNNGTSQEFAYARNGKKNYMIVGGEKFYRTLMADTLEINGHDQFWFGQARPDGINKLWLYLPERKTLNLITLFNQGKNLILSEKISGITVKRYFIRNMSLPGYHIIYSNPEENCITIKRLE